MFPTVSEALPSKTSFTVPRIQKCRTTLQRLSALPHKEFGTHGHKDRSCCGDEKGKGDWCFPSIRNIPGKDKVSCPQAVDTASSHGPVPACLMQTGAGCARGLSSCTHHSELLQLLGWHHATAALQHGNRTTPDGHSCPSQRKERKKHALF